MIKIVHEKQPNALISKVHLQAGKAYMIDGAENIYFMTNLDVLMGMRKDGILYASNLPPGPSDRVFRAKLISALR